MASWSAIARRIRVPLGFVFARACAPANADVPAKTVHGIEVANIDRSVVPGDDFYHYANGEWIKRAVIPPDRFR